MRLLVTITFLSLLGFSGQIQAQKLKNAQDSMSYAIGIELAEELKKQGFDDVDIKIFQAAFNDVMANKEPMINRITAKTMYKNEMRNRRERVNTIRMEEGLKFLEENAKRPEVTTIEKNIQYEVLKAGDGPSPEKGGNVKIHYEGRLLDGTVFDSSYDRGTPNTFNLKRLIKGWQIALPKMKVGDKWRIYIPYDQAYGERGAGKDIKPYSTLVFDIELLGI